MTATHPQCPCGCALSVPACMAAENPVERIIAAVASAYAITPADVKAKSRKAEAIPARQLAMALAWEIAGKELGHRRIMEAFGLNRASRTAVVHAHGRIAKATGRQRRLYDALLREFAI